MSRFEIPSVDQLAIVEVAEAVVGFGVFGLWTVLGNVPAKGHARDSTMSYMRIMSLHRARTFK